MFADGDRSIDFIRRLAWALVRRDGRVQALLACNYRPTRISGRLAVCGGQVVRNDLLCTGGTAGMKYLCWANGTASSRRWIGKEQQMALSPDKACSMDGLYLWRSVPKLSLTRTAAPVACCVDGLEPLGPGPAQANSAKILSTDLVLFWRNEKKSNIYRPRAFLFRLVTTSAL